MENEKKQFPSQGIVDQIKGLPKFNADVSKFINDTPDAIASYAEDQEGGVTLNIANATPEEVAKFQKANEILAEKGKVQIVLSSEKQVVNGVTRQITEEVVNRGREAFRNFILKVLKEEPELLVTEFNQFVVPRGKGYDDVHYWDNVGLGEGFYESLVRDGVEDMFDKLDDSGISDAMEKALDGKLDNVITIPEGVIDEIWDKCNILLVGMLSNMVRGLFYEHSNPGKVDAYRPRRIAVDTVNEWVAKGCPKDEDLYSHPF